LETYTSARELVDNPYFDRQRAKVLGQLEDSMIESIIIESIRSLNQLPYFYTLQCCFGHFLYPGQNDQHNLDPLPKMDSETEIEYRIAYIAFCIQNNAEGEELLFKLHDLAKIDPENIQFGSADWFWERQVNSYVLQVEPERFKCEDKLIFKYDEAVRLEKVRNMFYEGLRKLVSDME